VHAPLVLHFVSDLPDAVDVDEVDAHDRHDTNLSERPTLVVVQIVLTSPFLNGSIMQSPRIEGAARVSAPHELRPASRMPTQLMWTMSLYVLTSPFLNGSTMQSYRNESAARVLAPHELRPTREHADEQHGLLCALRRARVELQ